MTEQTDTLLDRIGHLMARRLRSESSGYEPYTPSDPETLHRTLQPGDILLVEGNQKISAAIKYLTQSTWSHAALYVGDVLPQPQDGSERPRLVEVNLGEGCVAVPLSKYRTYNTRICRASGLTPDDRRQVVEFMLYFLWDLGLKVGHATRSIDECIAHSRNDQTIRTSLLDARFLAGDRPVFDAFAERFREDCARQGAAAFVTAKRAERAERQRKYGDSAFLLEPNVKDGKGGLRDLQTLFWMIRLVSGITRFDQVDLCVAVAIDAGLVTPVIRNAAQRPLTEISAEAGRLIAAARDRSLTAEDLRGGTFTLSNLGMYGVRSFDAIINPPQGAILAVGGPRREARETADGGLRFASVATLTLSADHRGIDGAVAAQFLSTLKARIEAPMSLVM